MTTKKSIKKEDGDMSKLFDEAIADAKNLRAAALTNAKKALEEAFAPKLQAMFSEKVRQEVDGDEDGEYENPDEPAVIEGEEDDVDVDIDDDTGTDENPEPEIEDGEDDEVESETEPEDGEDDDIDFDFEDDDTDENPDAEIEEGEEDDVNEPEPDADEDDELEVPEIEEGEEDEIEPVEEPKDDDDMELEAILKELDGEDDTDVNVDDETEPEVDAEDDDLTEDEDIDIENDTTEEPVENEDDDIDLDEVLKSITEDEDIDIEDEPEDDEANEKLMASESKNAKLTKQIKEAVKVIKYMKTQLAETNLLNSKLYFANKIFKSNDKLDETQKMKVIDQFDRATSLREVKLVFATLIESLKPKAGKKVSSQVKHLTEGIASKVTGTTKPSKKVITESNEIVKRFQKLAKLS